MLLLIACSNVANLLLVRATARSSELAIRSSMGCGPIRLVLQFLIESSVISIIGCVLGALFAYFGLKLIVAVLPAGSGTGVPINAVFALNSRALLFAAAMCVLTTMLCAVAPALYVMRGELSSQLAGAGKGTSTGYRHGKVRSALVVTEIALSIVLLTGTGLMLRTLLALQHTVLGFNPENVLYARMSLPLNRYNSAEQKRNFYEQALTRIEGLPGVAAATVAAALPPYGAFNSQIAIPGKTHADAWYSLLDWCSEGYFRTVGLSSTLGS